MAKLVRILSGLLMIAVGSIFDVFVLELFGVLFFFNGILYKEKDKKVFKPHREELPIDEAILAEMKRDMGEDFVPPKAKKEEDEESQEEEKPSEEKSKEVEETNQPEETKPV